MREVQRFESSTAHQLCLNDGARVARRFRLARDRVKPLDPHPSEGAIE